MSTMISIAAGAAGFAEDKDYARMLRADVILPALDHGEEVTLDFGAVAYATQSFVHVLIGEALKKHGERVLELLEFKNCSPQLRSVVEFVVDYSLSGFAEPQHR
ncbi:STAS-like domain-containing protein [Longimicrobium sp.]|uniref:STAS-like domain-containing protein n=1 Tax=Longimicrobium sp. TaxID=2029185 RepID=UPI002D034EBD|nr:STAS-like domain-containing protein [Longimicrobium sp.]HSU12700.1 STAS-like domain-containing protein [Longimicrobium sp.]